METHKRHPGDACCVLRVLGSSQAAQPSRRAFARGGGRRLRKGAQLVLPIRLELRIGRRDGSPNMGVLTYASQVEHLGLAIHRVEKAVPQLRKGPRLALDRPVPFRAIPRLKRAVVVVVVLGARAAALHELENPRLVPRLVELPPDLDVPALEGTEHRVVMVRARRRHLCGLVPAAPTRLPADCKGGPVSRGDELTTHSQALPPLPGGARPQAPVELVGAQGDGP